MHEYYFTDLNHFDISLCHDHLCTWFSLFFSLVYLMLLPIIYPHLHTCADSAVVTAVFTPQPFNDSVPDHFQSSCVN